MLSVSGLCARYGAIEALRGVTFDVAEGEVITLLGANGAGKSTTLRTISGLLRPTAGSVTFDGEVINGRAPERIARLGIVHVPEGRQIIPGLTVLDNLKLGAANLRLPKREIPAGLDRVYHHFPRLTELSARLGWTLSGGEQQMLAIGRALMANPRLLVLDEPSLGLAPLVVQEVFRVIRRLHEEGATVLLVEQNAYQALRVADRGYLIESGRVVLSGTAPDLLAADSVRASYLGRRREPDAQH